MAEAHLPAVSFHSLDPFRLNRLLKSTRDAFSNPDYLARLSEDQKYHLSAVFNDRNNFSKMVDHYRQRRSRAGSVWGGVITLNDRDDLDDQIIKKLREQARNEMGFVLTI